jgi:two-component system response regulator YesN
MIKVLIVDDEVLVRIGIKTLIPWEEHGFTLIGEAASGVEALQLLEKTDCDIALIDISMPEMNGLELMETIRERWPHMKKIVLSNHHEFEYVQSALRLGAADYIIKLTIKRDELLQKLNDLKGEIEENQRKNQQDAKISYQLEQYGREVKEKRIRDLLLKQSTRQEIVRTLREYQIKELDTQFQIALCSIDHYEQLLEQNKFQSEQLLNFTIANIMGEIVKKHGDVEYAEIGQGRFAVLGRSISVDMVKEIGGALQTFIRLSMSAGISECLVDLGDIRLAYSQAERALNHRFYRGNGQITPYGDLPSMKGADKLPPIFPDLQKTLEMWNEAGLLEQLEAWFESCTKSEAWPPELIRDQWVEVLNQLSARISQLGGDIYAVEPYQEYYPLHMIRNGDTLATLCTWLTGWLPHYFQYAKQLLAPKWRSEIHKIVEMIEEQYHTQIRVSELAKMVGFQESYLSVLFKKEVGKTVIDYMTYVRLRKARELLQNPEYKIYEISELVGYPDSNHFSKLFKRAEGVLPTEYRSMVLGSSKEP